MDEIHQVVSKALSEHCSIRILGDVRTEALDPNNYLASITDLVRPFLDTWNSKDENTRVTFLAVDIYIRHSFFTRTRPVAIFWGSQWSDEAGYMYESEGGTAGVLERRSNNIEWMIFCILRNMFYVPMNVTLEGWHTLLRYSDVCCDGISMNSFHVM